jgi:hypothetical protein
MTDPVHINRVDRVTTYFATVKGTEYKAVHRAWGSAGPQHPAGERWHVWSHQGSHRYQRECDPEKPTYKRVVAAVKSAINGESR